MKKSLRERWILIWYYDWFTALVCMSGTSIIYIAMAMLIESVKFKCREIPWVKKHENKMEQKLFV